MAKRKAKAATLPVEAPQALPAMAIDLGPAPIAPQSDTFVPLKSCPQCHTESEPALVCQPIAVCSKCGCTMVIGEHVYRRAIHSDIMRLPDGDVERLRHARMAIVRR